MPRFAQAPLADMLLARRWCRVVSVVAAVHVALSAAGLPSVPCPAARLGFRCPGCGLTRGVFALCRGDLGDMLAWHALAPLAVTAALLVSVAAFAPLPVRDRLAAAVRTLEHRTGIAVAASALVVLYWAARLASGHGHAGPA